MCIQMNKLIDKIKNHTSNSESIEVLDETGFDICGGEGNGVLLEKLCFIEFMGWSGRFVWGGDVDFCASVISGRFSLGCGAEAIGIRWTSFARTVFSNQ